MERTDQSTIVPGIMAGAAAAGVWAAAEPVLAGALGTGYTDVRFLGRFLPSGRAWRVAGLAWHMANGAAFGAAFARVGGRGWKQGLAAAQAENALTWPLLPVVSRRHPDYRCVRWRSARGQRIFAQEVAMHALFGMLLGGLAGGRSKRRVAEVVEGPGPDGTRMPFDFDARFRPMLRLLGVTEDNSYVETTSDRLRARFGPWSLETDRSNIRCVSLAGPYRWFKAIGTRVSAVDRGITFGTNARRGVCIEFQTPVRAFDPLGLVRHPNLTVTVADPEALVSALERA
jgi:hypothetical protein